MRQIMNLMGAKFWKNIMCQILNLRGTKLLKPTCTLRTDQETGVELLMMMII